MDLQGKTVLVTGASSGIGRAVAIAFAQKRAHVLVHYGKNKSGAQATLDEVKAISSGSLCQADLMDRDQIAALFADIKKTTPTIDVLVNNAGDARAGEIGDDEVWDYEYKNIFISAVQMSREFLAQPSTNLRKIVNVTSLYGNLQTGEPHYLQYSAFKAALANLSATLNKSSAPKVIVTEWLDAADQLALHKARPRIAALGIDSPRDGARYLPGGAILLRAMPLEESSVNDIARAFAARHDLNLPLDEPTIAAQHYIALTPQQVQAAFQKWIRPQDLVRASEGPPPQ